jgi:hypothetical protein
MQSASAIERRTMAKVYLRLLPFCFVLYFICYLDRVNIGFAALTMNKDLGLSSYIFGLGAGAFFWGYFILEVPSNLILDKIGARRWIGRIMISWGLVSAAFAFTRGQHWLHVRGQKHAVFRPPRQLILLWERQSALVPHAISNYLVLRHGVPFWVPFHNVVTRDPNSAAASEPTPSDSITGVLAFAEERLIGHDRVVRMECPLVLDVGLIVGDPDHQTGGLGYPCAEGADIRHVRAPGLHGCCRLRRW